MNIVEALFITLGLDTRDYEKKQKEVTTSLKKMGETSDKQTKLIAESAKKAAHSFSLLKIEVLGAIAAYGLGDGIKSFIESNIAGNAALGRTAANLRMNTSELKAWGYAAESVGGKAEDAVSTMQAVAKAIADARLNGRSSFILASNKYGAGITGNDTAEEALEKINQVVYQKAQKYGPQVGLAIANALSVSNPAMQQLMLQGPDQLRQLVAHYRQYTGHVDSKDAMPLQQTMTDIRAAVGNLRDDLFSKMAPTMKVFAKKFEAFLDKITPKLEALAERFGKWLAGIDWNKVINAIGRFIDKVQEIVKEMGGWKTVAEILGGVLALKILAPLLTLVGTFARLVPMFVGATTGVSGLALAFGSLGVALAGVAGYWAGSELWTHVLAGTKAGDKIGDIAASTMATLGFKDAQEAENRMHGRGPKTPNYYHPERTDWYKGKEKQAVQYFMSQGFSRNAAIGMAANIARESKFNPHAAGDNGKAYGIGQWHPDRQADFAKVMGLPIQASSFQQQLAFYAHEVKHNKRLMGLLAQNPTASASAMLVSSLDERPANEQGEMIARAKIASQMVNAHVGAPRTAAAKPNSTTTVTLNGGITVNTKATDANGIAKDMQKAVRNNPLVGGYATVLN